MEWQQLLFIHVLATAAVSLHGCATQVGAKSQPLPAACEETIADIQQEHPEPLALVKERIDLLVAQLADEEYSVREEADKELRQVVCENIEDMVIILPYLRHHLDTTGDPEVEVRLKRIVRQLFASWARAAFRDERAESPRFDAYWRKWLEKVARHYGREVVQVESDWLMLVPMPKVTMTIQNANLRTVLKQIAAAGRAEVFIAPDVKGTVSIALRDVPWWTAFETVVKTLDYRVFEDGPNRLCVVRR
jgi:hypothetical protein